jgi:hypothetical protein
MPLSVEEWTFVVVVVGEHYNCDKIRVPLLATTTRVAPVRPRQFWHDTWFASKMSLFVSESW